MVKTHKGKTTPEALQGAARSKSYHFMILGGAIFVLLIGGLWRGGAVQQSVESYEISAIEALRKEVSGVQSALRRSELQAIRDTMAEITRDIEPLVVGLKPYEEGVPSLRRIPVYGTPGGAGVGLEIPRLAPGMSGLLIDPEGHILTSASIFKYSGPVEAVFGGSRQLADIVSVDRERHLALVKLRERPAKFSPLNLQAPPELEPGEWLVREGRSPSGTESRSLTLLESLQRTHGGDLVGLVNSDGVPQMDGSILINVAGRIVGMYVHPAESGAFVLPINRALDIAYQLKANPLTAPKGWAGMELQELSEDLKEYFSVTEGVLISSVSPDGPAAKAGLRQMDLILTLNGETVTSPVRVMELISQAEPETTFALGIRRNARESTIEMTVDEPPEKAQKQRAAAESTLVIELLPAPAPASGALISTLEPQSIANKLGLQPGDIIESINRSPVRSAAQFWTQQRNISTGEAQLWGVRRGNRLFFVAIKESVERL